MIAPNTVCLAAAELVCAQALARRGLSFYALVGASILQADAMDRDRLALAFPGVAGSVGTPAKILKQAGEDPAATLAPDGDGLCYVSDAYRELRGWNAKTK